MDKKIIIDKLKEKVQKEISDTKEAYKQTQQTIQSGDLKSDGKYDTRATELNYLADGQRARINDLENELLLLEDIPLVTLTKNDEVSIGSVVTLKLGKMSKLYFLAPTAGGTMLNIDGEVIMVISVFSPIGSQIINMQVGDSVEVEIGDDIREYTIESHF